MAIERVIAGFSDSQPSAADLTGKERCFLTRVSGGVQLCGAAGVIAGVCSQGRPVGKHSSFNTGGQLKVIAGGTIAVDDSIESDASGHAITGSTNACGRAMNAAAAGELVTIAFN